MNKTLPAFSEIADDFAFIDDWDEKYRYIIDLGRQLTPLSDALKSEETRVRGCASQVWLVKKIKDGKLFLSGDSDAAIVKGLVAIVIALFNGKTVSDARSLDARAALEALGLQDHITPQRANGLISMLKKIEQMLDNTD